MKIEFLDNISNGGEFKGVVSDRLIRLYDFDPDEALQFQNTVKKLIQDQTDIRLDSLSFIKPVNCSLTLSISDKDLGIDRTEEGEFQCKLTIDTYREMISYIQPFVDNESDGYQWLFDNTTDIDLLFSPGGTW